MSHLLWGHQLSSSWDSVRKQCNHTSHSNLRMRLTINALAVVTVLHIEKTSPQLPCQIDSVESPKEGHDVHEGFHSAAELVLSEDSGTHKTIEDADQSSAQAAQLATEVGVLAGLLACVDDDPLFSCLPDDPPIDEYSAILSWNL